MATMGEKAIRIILETGKGSISVLQRRLNIDYNEAFGIIESLIKKGVLKERCGCQSCEINEEWMSRKLAAI